jgi:hypothetical protein
MDGGTFPSSLGSFHTEEHTKHELCYFKKMDQQRRSNIMGPETSLDDLFDDMWDAKPRSTPIPRPKPLARNKPTPPSDRVVGEFSIGHRTSLREGRQKRENQRRAVIQGKYEFESIKKRKREKIKGLIINVLIPIAIILAMIISGQLFYTSKKEVPTQTVEIVDTNRPVITRSE